MFTSWKVGLVSLPVLIVMYCYLIQPTPPPAARPAVAAAFEWVVPVPDEPFFQNDRVGGTLDVYKDLCAQIDGLLPEKVLQLAEQLSEKQGERYQKAYYGILLEKCLVRLAELDYEPAYDLLAKYATKYEFYLPGISRSQVGEIQRSPDPERPVSTALRNARPMILPKLYYNLETTLNREDAFNYLIIIGEIEERMGIKENPRAIDIFERRFP